MISFQVIIVIAILVFLIVGLYREVFSPVIVFVICALALVVAQILEPKDILAGFANEQIAVIFLLLILSDIIKKTGALDLIFNKFFSPNLSHKHFLARMMFSVSGFSAFVNNTPLVAILIPYVYDWAKKKGISPSKVMLPLSYAAILGGTVTLVGTSTNLIVNSLAISEGYPSLGFFDFSFVGIPLVFIGGIYMIFVGSRILPERQDAMSSFNEKSREYLVETMINNESELIGKTINEANLRNLRGLFLVEIIRNEKLITPVSPVEIIVKNDKLIFAGVTETIIDLINVNKNFSLPDIVGNDKGKERDLIEVVVSANSAMAGKLIKDTNYRAKYDAAIIAIHRGGEKLSGKIGELEIRPGDVLLLLAGKNFKARADESQDIYIISKLREFQDIDTRKVALFAASTIGVFVLAAMSYITLFFGLLLLVCLIAVLNFVKIGDIRYSIDFNLLAILALSLAIGKAIQKSGADAFFSDIIIRAVQPLNSTIAVLAGIYIITNLLTMVITNAAAVSITFPIAIAAVKELGIPDATPFILAVAFAGSAEFITPFGYQTNLMVFGPGGYKFKDYINVGMGLTLMYMVTCVGLLSYLYGLK